MNDVRALLRQTFTDLLPQELHHFIKNWPAPRQRPEVTPPTPPKVLAWLPQLAGLTSPSTDRLVSAFAASAQSHHWRQTYSADDFGQHFIDRYGYVEIVGPRSFLYSEDMAAGLLMFGPEIQYPAHRHPAEELYVPIAGSARFISNDNEAREGLPGTVIHNRPMDWHGITTGVQPVLIAWAWLGGNPAVRSEVCQRGSRSDRTI